ncbi:MAG TPA: CAP domain-containing protein [bacterium]|mgnify:FL=1|nr:CAP domain-containing protein [bacterium]HPW39776.1 CAP domain-containing protein [bacterium]
MLQGLKKILLIITVFLIIVKTTIGVAIFLYPPLPEDDNLSISPKRLIELTNDYRQRSGLNELKPNARLTQAAYNKASDLLTGQYFDHTSPDGRKFSQWIKDVDYQYFYVGENLAIDFVGEDELFQAWLNSPQHRENIIKPQYQEIGIAALRGKYKNHPTIVVVQLFGTRVLGEQEQATLDYEPLNDLANNYFYHQSWWQKFLSLDKLDRINNQLGYALVISLGIYLALYRPQKNINQINIKHPIINRYQAKIFRE